jgi:hypothetical protein
MSKTDNTEVEIDGITLSVDYYYDKGEPMVMYYPDMSGHPGSPPSVEIYGVYADGETDIYELLSDRVIDTIEETILGFYE